jgi:hypothetical protein
MAANDNFGKDVESPLGEGSGYVLLSGIAALNAPPGAMEKGLRRRRLIELDALIKSFPNISILDAIERAKLSQELQAGATPLCEEMDIQ